jgi:hypothetical protein
MTDQHSDDSFDEAITTEKEFEAMLSKLLIAAIENGIDPEGSWVCRNGASTTDIEVMITELADGRE